MNKIKWQDNPPDYNQWVSVKNEGLWWIKIIIPPMSQGEFTFKETYFYEVVRIYFQLDSGSRFPKKGKLIFKYNEKSLSCNDLPKYFLNYKWQPVVAHTDMGD